MATRAARPHYLRWMISFVAIGFLVSLLLGGLTGCGGGGGNDGDNGNGGDPGNGAPDPAPDPAPLALSAAGGDGEVILEWPDVDGADSYTLYYATEGGIQPDSFGIWVSQHNGVMIENVTSPRTVAGLDNGTEYYFLVTATLDADETDRSNEVVAVPQETVSVTGELNDTGIVRTVAWAGLGSTPEQAAFCDPDHPAGQDCQFGRDAQALAGELTKVGGGNAGFDFTKIANDGTELPSSASLGSGPNDWACTRDNVTGLIWEVKQADRDDLRYEGHTYTWYDPASPDGNPGSQDGGNCSGSDCDTTGFVQAVNDQGLCGASDWRMPTRLELHGLVDYGRFEPGVGLLLDAGYFPGTFGEEFWSGSPSAKNSSNAWHVDFGRLSGHVDDNDGRGLAYHVRLVRDQD